MDIIIQIRYKVSMLTNQDINLIKEAIRGEIKPLETRFGTLEMRIEGLEDDMNKIQKNISRIQKDQKMIINFFDHEGLNLRNRVEYIEKILKIVPKS